MPNSKTSPAKTAAPRAPRRRAKTSPPRDGENNSGKNFAEQLYAAFRSTGVDFEIVIPPRRGKKRARPVPYIKVR